MASARTIATRCCWPPESRSGYSRALSARPIRPSSSSAVASASARGRRSALRGPRVTLSSTDMCGNRLNDWNTIPIRRRMASARTPGRGDVLVVEDHAARVDRLEQVETAQQRRLARARRADQADDLVVVDGQVDAAQDLELAERFVKAFDPQDGRPERRPLVRVDCGRAGRHPNARVASCRRRSRSTR